MRSGSEPDGLSTGIDASLNRARTQRDVERRERSAGKCITACEFATSNVLAESTALPNTASAELFARSAAAEGHAVPFPMGNKAPARLCTCNIRRDSQVLTHLATDWGDSVALMHCALLQVRLLRYCAQHTGSTVESVKEPRGRTNTTERKAKCKIKGWRHGVFK